MCNNLNNHIIETDVAMAIRKQDSCMFLDFFV